MTVVDASALASAEAYGCAPVTADGGLARASGLRCPVEVIGG
ncbi:hypothetical protein [Streptomyces sp. CC208A]|nr:hypothetical protein [Streptomyces sp. CC208A]